MNLIILKTTFVSGLLFLTSFHLLGQNWLENQRCSSEKRIMGSSAVNMGEYFEITYSTKGEINFYYPISLVIELKDGRCITPQYVSGDIGRAIKSNQRNLKINWYYKKDMETMGEVPRFSVLCGYGFYSTHDLNKDGNTEAKMRALSLSSESAESSKSKNKALSFKKYRLGIAANATGTSPLKRSYVQMSTADSIRIDTTKHSEKYGFSMFIHHEFPINQWLSIIALNSYSHNMYETSTSWENNGSRMYMVNEKQQFDFRRFSTYAGVRMRYNAWRFNALGYISYVNSGKFQSAYSRDNISENLDEDFDFQNRFSKWLYGASMGISITNEENTYELGYRADLDLSHLHRGDVWTENRLVYDQDQRLFRNNIFLQINLIR